MKRPKGSHLRDEIATTIPAGAVDLVAPNPPSFRPIDLVAEGVAAPGVNRFHVAEGQEWGSMSRDWWILGASVLATRTGRAWGPVVGARVVLLVEDPEKPGGRALFDLCTRGDGSTVALPVGTVLMARADGASMALPVGTILLPRGRKFRLEVESPESAAGAEAECQVCAEVHPGAHVRAVLHGVVNE